MRTAVVICPGRGTYGAAELGYLARHHAGAGEIAAFDAIRAAAGQETVSALDGAERFSTAKHTRGDAASPLIYACSLLDALSLTGVEVVAVTGNSMGWYTALAAAGAVTPTAGFEIANTMGTLMQAHMIGGQLVYPFLGDDWRPDPARKAALLEIVAGIGARAGHVLGLSIDLGGMLVLAGNAEGLAAFEAAVPRVDRFPMRLANHAGFHTALQAPVAAEGQSRLGVELFGGPRRPLIDGRGQVWWPHATDPVRLRAYTLGHQVTEPYDFTHAIATAAREFAPDLFIVTGPGTTMGGAVAQSLVLAGWQGLACREDVRAASAAVPFIVSMGDPGQRALLG